MISTTEFVLWCLFVVALLACAAPVIVYFCVKCGTYAYFKGKKLFQQDQETKDGKA